MSDNVNVSQNCYVGSSSTIKQKVKINHNVLIG